MAAIIQRDQLMALEAQTNFLRFQAGYGGVGQMTPTNVVVDEAVERVWASNLMGYEKLLMFGS